MPRGQGMSAVSDTPIIRVMRSPLSFTLRLEKLSEAQQNLIKSTGFGNLLGIPKHDLNKNLLTELIDKWSIERHAFQFAGSDISMTPMDIALVMGLRVVGKPVILPEDQPVSDLENEYATSPTTRKISYAYLKDKLDALGNESNDVFTRTFLMFAFASFLFPSSNGDIDSRYLNLLRDLDEVHQYAWGVAVLDNVTSWVSKRKEEGVTCVGGCLAFLQTWFYEHVDMARPSLHMDAFPRICRWRTETSHVRSWVKRSQVKAAFEDLKDEQVIRELQPTEFEAVRIRELLSAQGPQDDATEFEELLPAPDPQDDEDLQQTWENLTKEVADLTTGIADLRDDNARLRERDRLRRLANTNLMNQIIAALSISGRRR